jgi:hypothetical protein
MRSTSRELVKSALKDGWKFELLAEGYHLKDKKNKICKECTNFDEIMEHIHSVDAIVELHMQKKGEKDDWANIIMCNEPDEEISDCYVGGYIDKWCERTDFGQDIV